MDGTYVAYVDRIVDSDHAVVLLEEDGETKDHLVLELSELPSTGRRERAVLQVEIENGELIEAKHLLEEERKRRKRIRKKTAGLRMRIDDLDRE